MDENNGNLQLGEITVLGNILSDSEGRLILTAVQLLSADDFLDERNRAVFNSMLEINAKGNVPDLALVSETLKSNHLYDAIGGDGYLEMLLEKAARIAPIEGYIKAIKDRNLLNKFVKKLRETADIAASQPISDVSEFIGKAENEINEIAKERSVKEAKRLAEISPSLVGQWVEQSKEFREKGISPTGITGIPTGYEALDNLTKGWHKGHLIIIGARPSVGKTAFTLNLLYNVAVKNIPVIFFSLEMASESIEMRLLELASNLTSTEINSLDFTPDSTADKIKVNCKNPTETANVTKLQNGLKALGKLPFYVDENPGTTMLDIAAKCRKLMNGQNIKAGVIAIDYIGLINSTKGNMDRNQQVAEISRGLKLLAKELKVPIIALSQLSRDSAKRGADHRPQLTDLRDSGTLEQDADMVFFLYREDYFNDGKKGKKDGEEAPVQEETYSPISQVDLNLAKNRDGSLGTVKFIFDKEHCQFSAREDDFSDGGF